MLTVIKDNEIITTREASKRYNDKYFIMIITEIVDQGDNDLGYVIYTADSRRELSQVPRDEYKGLRAAFKIGGAAEPYPTVGNVVYHAQV